ncbi:LutC/YkgG family protein [Caldimonas tepidiphila]|uniref:LutC/YkgG family protein n=1 Tax=Caldimonas tepidiphila TaxID=2315841 RepID=UPI000E5ACA8B|nr:lactate utilization protein C [Caldimonas tepidiphila]
MNARNAILARLREAAPAAPLPRPELEPYYRSHPGLRSASRAEQVDAFTRNARGWRAEVLHCTPADWPAAVAQALAARGARRVALGRDTSIAAPLQAALAGTEPVWFERDLDEWKQELFDRVDASVTTALAGLADTGTLVLVPDAREPRSLSLVPPVHIAVLPASRLHDTLPGAMQALRPHENMPTNLVLVTGPSKTSDIQQTLAFGAHGPKELVIVLVDDSEGSAP